MTLTETLIKERDYYRDLCIKHGLLGTGAKNATVGVKSYIPLPEIAGYLDKNNYLQLSNGWAGTCKRVWDELSVMYPDITFDQLTKKHIQDFFFSKGELSKSSRSNYLSAIKNVVKLITEYYDTEVNLPLSDPTKGIVIRRTDAEKDSMVDNKEKFLRIKDFEKWSTYPFEGNDEYARNLSLLQCYTGLAPNELAAFDPETHVTRPIDEEEQIISIRRRKTIENGDAYSRIPIFPETAELIKYFEANRASERHFLIVPGGYYKKLKKLSLKASLSTQMTPHGGRHTFGYLGLMKGFSMAAISKMLGHASVTTTERIYATVDIDHIMREYREIKSKAI